MTVGTLNAIRAEFFKSVDTEKKLYRSFKKGKAAKSYHKALGKLNEMDKLVTDLPHISYMPDRLASLEIEEAQHRLFLEDVERGIDLLDTSEEIDPDDVDRALHLIRDVYKIELDTDLDDWEGELFVAEPELEIIPKLFTEAEADKLFGYDE